MKYKAYIGLGSNVASRAGSPEETVRAAVRALGELGQVTAESSLYRTAPVGYKEQPDFVNAAVCVETEMRPEDLLRALLETERGFGRDRAASVPKGPRTLDLDLLLALDGEGRGLVLETAALTLPHPEMERRRFVLEPMAEIAPELRHPVSGRTMRELADEARNNGEDVRRI